MPQDLADSSRPSSRREYSIAASETIASYLQVTDVLEAVYDVLIADYDRRDAEVDVPGFPIKAGAQLPSRGQHYNHVAADDAVFSRYISKCSRQVIKRYLAKIIGN